MYYDWEPTWGSAENKFRWIWNNSAIPGGSGDFTDENQNEFAGLPTV